MADSIVTSIWLAYWKVAEAAEMVPSFMWCLQIPQGFPLAGQINQANYAQFAAVLAQQAARQRQAQELAAQQAQRAQQVRRCSILC